MSDPLRCPHCHKAVADQNALWQHAKAQHGTKVAKVFKQPRDAEPSLADELIEATEAHAGGEAPPEYLVVMFPEAFANRPVCEEA